MPSTLKIWRFDIRGFFLIHPVVCKKKNLRTMQFVFILKQLLLFDLQLQHDSIQFHVEVIGSLQLPLVVFSDVQCMSGGEESRGRL